MWYVADSTICSAKTNRGHASPDVGTAVQRPYVSSGCLYVRAPRIISQPSFLDYIFGGCEINLHVRVARLRAGWFDLLRKVFDASNGSLVPDTPRRCETPAETRAGNGERG